MRIRGTVINSNGTLFGGEGCKYTFEMVSATVVGGQGPWTRYWQGRNIDYDREPSLHRAGGAVYDKSQVIKSRDRLNWWRQQNAERRQRLKGSNYEARAAGIV
jgi:hypothetical protein